MCGVRTFIVVYNRRTYEFAGGRECAVRTFIAEVKFRFLQVLRRGECAVFGVISLFPRCYTRQSPVAPPTPYTFTFPRRAAHKKHAPP